MVLKIKQSAAAGKIFVFVCLSFVTLIAVYFFIFMQPSKLSSTTLDSGESKLALTSVTTQRIRRAPVNPDLMYVNMTVSSTIGVGNVIIEVHKDWAPLGAARFEELIKASYFDEAKFFRVIKVCNMAIHILN